MSYPEARGPGDVEDPQPGAEVASGGRAADDTPSAFAFAHPAESEFDTVEEQARLLLHELRESFAPSYLTLISIIEGVLLGLTFELLSEGRPVLRWDDPVCLLVFNNVLIIALVWNEYRMGSFMYRWVPSLVDAVIPFALGGLQAVLVLSVARPTAWLGWLAVFYLGAIVAFENMYRRSAAEARNEFVIHENRRFRRLNPYACAVLAMVLAALAGFHGLSGVDPGWTTLTAVTFLNLGFLIRGEVNWRIVVRAARRARR